MRILYWCSGLGKRARAAVTSYAWASVSTNVVWEVEMVTLIASGSARSSMAEGEGSHRT